MVCGWQKLRIKDICNDTQSFEGLRRLLVSALQHNRVVNLSAGDVNSFMKSNGFRLAREVSSKDVEPLDGLVESVLLKHKQACEVGHLSAVHQIRPNQTFVGLGGFKLMYPLFERSLASNLLSE